MIEINEQPLVSTVTPTVFIVDDDAGMRRSLAFVMEAEGLFSRVFASADEFLQAYRPEQPGCLLLDLRMPEKSGLELLEHLRLRHYEIPVIILTGHADVPAVVRSMKLGVVDFLEKPADHRVMLERVREALRMDGQMRQKQGERDSAVERLSRLTIRERHLLDLLIVGKSNKEIAAELGISVKTVANHRAHLMAKTQALNSADLVRMSMLAGIHEGEVAKGGSE